MTSTVTEPTSPNLKQIPSGPKTREPPSIDNLIKAWVVRIFVLPILLLVCLVVTSAGIRDLFDMGGIPLGKWILKLAEYQETKKLDFAHVLAFGLMTGFWFALENLSRILHQHQKPETTLDKAKRGIYFGLVALDAIFFFTGFYVSSGFMASETATFFATLIFTALYILLLSFTAFKITELERGYQ